MDQKPQVQVTQHSPTVRAVAELLQVETWDKVPATVMQALAQVLICADEECHPLTAALSVLDDAPVERRFEAMCIAARIEPNSRERRCHLCGYEWTGSSSLCPSCRDGYHNDFMGSTYAGKQKKKKKEMETKLKLPKKKKKKIK